MFVFLSFLKFSSAGFRFQGLYLCKSMGIAVFLDRFPIILNILISTPEVMCDAYTPAGEPILTNKRFNAEKIFSHPDVAEELCVFTWEEEL